MLEERYAGRFAILAMRKKLPKRKTLKTKLDRIFSLYIRKRDAACVLCGSTQNPNNGHLFSRRALSTRWCEINCNQQCYPCNFRHTMDFYPYQNWFVKKHGQEAYDELYRKYRSTRKITRTEMVEMIEYYKDKLE
jgi:hypothetical protein